MLKNKRVIKSIIALSVIASSSLYATNGDTLIGVGAKTRSMGGAGIALGHGAESTLVNPALITTTKGTAISFGGTVFAPTIETDVGPTGTETKSAADLSMIPEVAIATNLGNSIYLGIGMYGTAGMGTDFRDATSPMQAGLMKMETTLQLMQFVAPIAYKSGGLSVAIAPVLQYGSLDIHYNNGAASIGNGQQQDFGFGFTAGATYDFANGFSVGAVYKSKIKMEYKGALSTATQPFVDMGAFPSAMKDNLNQPAEIGVGIAYQNGAHSIALDYKKIKWGSAAGYKEFGWKDQDVIAVGYQYDAGIWSARVGFNHAKSPISLNPGTSKPGAALNYFNLLGFPATSENHFTAGGTYHFSKNFSADLTVVYSPKKTTSANISGLGMPAAKIINKHSELGATIQFNYKF